MLSFYRCLLLLVVAKAFPLPKPQVCDSTVDVRSEIMDKVRSILLVDQSFVQGRRGFFGTASKAIGSSNPTTVFGISALIWPDQRAPHGFCEFVEAENPSPTVWGTNQSTCNTTWFLGRQDAFVWFGCTPPEVRYFHMRTFVEVHTDDPIHFPSATLGDTINNANVNTTGGADGVDPFNRSAVIISTADLNTYELVADAFVAAGVPRSAINLDVLPSSYWINFLDDKPYGDEQNTDYTPEDNWYNSKADGLILVGRFTGFRSEQDQEYYSNTISQAMIFHRNISASSGQHIPIARLPEYVTRLKGTGKSESIFTKKLTQLRANLLKKMKEQNFVLLASSMHQKDLRDDYRCIHYDDYSVFYGGPGGFCDMQPLDVSYSGIEWMFQYMSPNNQTLRLAKAFSFNDVVDLKNPEPVTERVFISIGVNHNTYKNVGYNSIMVSPLGEGFESLVNSSYFYDDAGLAQSADTFGDGFENLFAVATARGSTCQMLSSIFPGCFSMSQSRMAPHVPIVTVERIYLEYETKTGPAIEELLQVESFVFEREISESINVGLF